MKEQEAVTRDNFCW